ncbi:MAG: SCO family protein [Melioribacteraceae bacterium]|nr:SCO family protein [Melioribacteraceae bacterium]
MKRLFNILLITIAISLHLNGQEIEVGIDEKIGDFIPMDIEFFTSDGDTVKLNEVIDRPFLLALVYYDCPGICSPLLTELTWVADRVQLEPNKEFKIITLSFDPRETPELAANWKKNYFNSFRRNFPEEAWTFLTGNEENIKKITDAVGFYYKPTQDDFLHAGALIAISPEGKISRYIFGSTYNPFDVKMALLDAGSGKTNPTVAKVLQFCFSYDPEGRSYSLNITRIIGSVMLIMIGVFLTVLLVKKRKDSKN